jgi:hypothetical protein
VPRALTNVLARPKAILLGITRRPAHPSARRLMDAVPKEADMPDIPLLLIDGNTLPDAALCGAGSDISLGLSRRARWVVG